jgi:NAD(P)-dependent dehydrogenase (short-subunit alcohol dehydrogenase family)
MNGEPKGELSGRTCIVTGANGGIGREVARGLAHKGAKVVLACRNLERGRTALEHLRADTGSDQLRLMQVDMSEQNSIREFAQQFLTEYEGLDVLVNNAGIWPRLRELTGDGIELTWDTNVLGYFLLTKLLLARLEQNAPARIINVASRFAGDLDLGDVQFDRRAFAAVTAYTQSKQANRMLTWALAKRLEGTGVTANAVHPGLVNSSLLDQQRGVLGAFMSAGAKVMGRQPSKGADSIIWLASDPIGAEVNGKFWMNRREIPCKFRDLDQAEALWRKCYTMTLLPDEAAPSSRAGSMHPPTNWD